MPKQVTITPEVRAVLERGRAAGNLYHLPDEQLDRSLYVEVNKVLVALGGKWSRKDRAHVFAGDCREALADALAEGVAVDRKRTADQFFTPPEVAERVWRVADLRPEHHVLEPSAGAGGLLDLPDTLGCALTLVEKDLRLADELAERFRHRPATGVWYGDFIEWSPTARKPIDRVLMNPPFTRGADMAHVLRALGFLEPGGRLVAIMSPHWTFARDGASERFRAEVARHVPEWSPLPAGSFRPAGTDVATGILTITKERN